VASHALSIAFIATLVLVALALFLTLALRRTLSRYKTTPAGLHTGNELKKRAESLSLASRIAALVAAVPFSAALAINGIQPLANTAIAALGLTIAVALGLAGVQQAAKIPIKTLWNPEVAWTRQVGLGFVGSLLGAVVPALYLLMTDPQIRAAVLERVSGK
jgi:hypothetical protein